MDEELEVVVNTLTHSLRGLLQSRIHLLVERLVDEFAIDSEATLEVVREVLGGGGGGTEVEEEAEEEVEVAASREGKCAGRTAKGQPCRRGVKGGC